jgi:hypothetical protein
MCNYNYVVHNKKLWPVTKHYVHAAERNVLTSHMGCHAQSMI